MAHKAQTYEHLLIVRLSAMGDVAICVPVVKQLRKDNPRLRITILTRSKWQVFFRDIADIGFISPEFEGRHKGLKGIFRLSRDIAAEGVDAVADLHDVLRTKILRVLLRLKGARVAVVDKGRAEKRALTRKFRKLRTQLTPTVRRYGDALQSLGLRLGDPVPANPAKLPLSNELLELTGPKTGVWVGISPFSQHQGKVYPTIHTDSLIGLLAERYSRVFVFGGGEHERQFSEYMEQRYEKVTSVIGRVGLGEEMDLVSNLDCMISMDSAAMHLASIVGTPVVSIWGATHPYAGFYGFGQRPADAVQLDMACRPCSVYGNKPCLYRDYRCLNRIPPTTVLEHVTAVVERKK